MYDKQGFILIEALLMFMVVLFLALITVLSSNIIYQYLQKGSNYDAANEIIQSFSSPQ